MEDDRAVGAAASSLSFKTMMVVGASARAMTTVRCSGAEMMRAVGGGPALRHGTGTAA
jgi:hypothetical protein